MTLVPIPDRPASLSLRDRVFMRRLQAAERPVPRRPMTASATPVNLGDKTEARRMRVLRQGWQADAAAYVHAIPELSFAYRFLANASARMRFFPAFVNPEEPDGPPIPVKDHPEVPQALKDAMANAMDSLGVGRLGMAPLQTAISYGFGVSGECWLLGQQDPMKESWSVRSIEEVQIWDDVYKLREVPLDPQGILGYVDLDPDTTYLSRMWIPDFLFAKLAFSPMRALLDTSEELLLLSRDVRAVARSRLAGAGILKIPEGLRMIGMTEQNQDPQSEDWMGRFAEAMMTPLADEGTASAVVPIAVGGAPDDLAALEHILIDRPYSALAIELRAEAIGRIATGLDFPREILEGIGDVNHWSGALVSDETFRHHIEPQVIAQCDAMSVAYMRVYLTAAGWDPWYVNRACIWYDPVDLVSKPDPIQNAVLLHDRLALSNAALREAGGFKETDEPAPLEIEFRMLQKTRTFPPNMVEAIFHAWDPNLQFPPINTAGTVPGIGPQGEIAAEPPQPAVPALPAAPTVPAVPSMPDIPPTAPAVSAPQPVVLASDPDIRARIRLSRRLTEVDSQLRARLQTAAAGAVIRALDRAGAKLRTKVNDRKLRVGGATEARLAVAGVPNRKVAQVLGRPIVAALGFADAAALVTPDFSELRGQFEQWVTAAQAQAVRTARMLAGLPADHPAVTAATVALAAQVSPAWAQLEQALTLISQQALYDIGDDGDDDTVTVDPNTVVPSGVMRGVLSVAGGLAVAALLNRTTGGPDTDAATQAEPLGQVGSGSIIVSLLSDNGLVPVSRTWEHLGSSDRPFEPHLDLDGVTFTSFTDDVLANQGDWPPVDFYLPGDHDSCGCDFTTEYGPAGDADSSDDDDTEGDDG